MAQAHLDRLSAVDASFLHQEDARTHMHIGGVVVLEGPPPGYDELREHVRSRLPLLPRYRQKLAAAPVGLSRWRWVDDPRFNLDYHLRHSALPAPGSERELRRLVGRVFAQALDRTKPLWELWFVEGLEGGRFAIVSKTHHALVDGVSGVDIGTVLFDLTKVPSDAPVRDAWQPAPEPSAAELAAAAVQDGVQRLTRAPLEALGAVAQPGRAVHAVREAAEGLLEVAGAGRQPPPPTPLNVPISPHRRFATLEADLADLKAVKQALGGTVNDVVLAAVGGGLQRFFHHRGIRTQGLDLRVCVPVSTRAREDRGSLGNKLTQLVVTLPVGEADPAQRLRRITAETQGLKESRQALGAEVIASAQDFAPPTILAQASRLNFANRFFNLLVTNVPGPQVPLYVLGRRAEAVFPVPFLAGDRALAVAVMSYDGRLGFGLLGDLDALPDLDVLADGVEEALDELRAAARGEGRPRSRRRRSAARERVAAAPDPEAGDPTPSPSVLAGAKGRAGAGPAARRRAQARRTGSRSPAKGKKGP